MTTVLINSEIALPLINPKYYIALLLQKEGYCTIRVTAQHEYKGESKTFQQESKNVSCETEAETIKKAIAAHNKAVKKYTAKLIESANYKLVTAEQKKEFTTLLAIEFSKVITQWHTPEELKEVNRLNKTKDYQDGSCASHNYYDANQAMIDAFEIVFKRLPEIIADFDNDVTNNAWTIARKHDFNAASIPTTKQ